MAEGAASQLHDLPRWESADRRNGPPSTWPWTDVTTTAADYDDFATAVTAAVAAQGYGQLTFVGNTLTFTGQNNGMADLVISLGAVDDGLAEGDEESAS